MLLQKCGWCDYDILKPMQACTVVKGFCKSQDTIEKKAAKIGGCDEQTNV